jgi:hypothetical protein
MTHRYKNQPQDEQEPQSGKVENDHNKQGNQPPGAKNEGKRTPHSRHDRDDKIGNNQAHMRKGGPNQGEGGGKGKRGG